MIDYWKVKRTEPRISLVLPIVIEGKDLAKNHFREETVTENVSKGGACVILSRQLEVGATIFISARNGKFRSNAVIREIWVDRRDNKIRIGVQFTDPTQGWVVT